jgi:putative ABC transport system permease protein
METPLQVIWMIGLIALLLALSASFRLKTTIGLGIAIGRGILQFFVFSYLVAMAVAIQQPWVDLGAILLLLILAVQLTANQLSTKIPIFVVTLGALTIGLAVPLIYGIALVIQPDPWFDAKIMIPTVSVILANAVSGAVIAGEHLLQNLQNNPTEIETHLCLGSSIKTAIAPYRQAAIQAAMLPLISQFTVLGLTGVPLLMAGGMVSGGDPLQAAAYQLLLMLMGALATLITVLILCEGISQRFFNPSEQLLRW